MLLKNLLKMNEKIVNEYQIDSFINQLTALLEDVKRSKTKIKSKEDHMKDMDAALKQAQKMIDDNKKTIAANKKIIDGAKGKGTTRPEARVVNKD